MVTPLKIEDRWLRIDGRTVHFRCGGTGKPLVLVHGLGGPLMWQYVEQPLAAVFHVIVVDLAGFGSSEPPKHRMSTEDYANLLAGLFDALDLRDVVIAGISYGGQVCITFAHRHPGRVAKLILISSTGLQTVERFPVHKSLFRGILHIVQWTLLHNPALICYLSRISFHRITSRPGTLCRDFYHQLSRKGNRAAWCNALFRVFTERSVMLRISSEIRKPVLLVWGRNDRIVPVGYAHEFRGLLGNPSLVVIDECAHSVPLEQPDRLTRIIVRFATGRGGNTIGTIPTKGESHETTATWTE